MPFALQQLLDTPQPFFALVLSPTRELAIQISEQFEALGVAIGLKSAVLVGGIDMMAQARPWTLIFVCGRHFHFLIVGLSIFWEMAEVPEGLQRSCLRVLAQWAARGCTPGPTNSAAWLDSAGPGPGLRTTERPPPPAVQAIALAKRPHVIVGTPGRVVDHLTNTKGFSLKALKHLVLDEADRLLNMDFEQEIDAILKAIPKDRRTQLFSATMTSKVAKLQRACLRNPARVEVAAKNTTVATLRQEYLFVPAKYKDCYLVFLLTGWPPARHGCLAFCACVCGKGGCGWGGRSWV